MESANIAAVREMLELFNRGELDELMRRFTAEDVEVDYGRSFSPDQAKVFRGRDEARRFLEALREPWGRFELVADEFVELGDDTVVVESHSRSVGRGSGVEVIARGAVLIRFRAGTVSKWQLFQSKEHALEAAEAA